MILLSDLAICGAEEVEVLEVLGSSDEILPQLAVELQQSGPEPDALQDPVSSSARQLRAPAEEQPAQLEGSDAVASSAALYSNGDQRQLEAGVEKNGAGSLQDLDNSGGDGPHSNGIHQQQGERAETLLSVYARGFLGSFVFSATCMAV